MAGEAATIGTFSFFPSKNLGGWGDGGMMVTQDPSLSALLLKLRTHGSQRTYEHELVGYNSRLDALQAAVLKAKLPHLAAWSAARRANAAHYDPPSPTWRRSPRPWSIRATSRSSISTPSGHRAARCAARAPQGGRGSGATSTIRCRSTCSRASRISAGARDSSRSPSARPRRCSRCRSTRNSRRAAAEVSGRARLLRALRRASGSAMSEGTAARPHRRPQRRGRRRRARLRRPAARDGVRARPASA
jgi:hypothetical protein